MTTNVRQALSALAESWRLRANQNRRVRTMPAGLTLGRAEAYEACAQEFEKVLDALASQPAPSGIAQERERVLALIDMHAAKYLNASDQLRFQEVIGWIKDDARNGQPPAPSGWQQRIAAMEPSSLCGHTVTADRMTDASVECSLPSGHAGDHDYSEREGPHE